MVRVSTVYWHLFRAVLKRRVASVLVLDSVRCRFVSRKLWLVVNMHYLCTNWTFLHSLANMH